MPSVKHCYEMLKLVVMTMEL